MFSFGVAYGHDLYDRLPDDIFQFKMSWDPTLLFFVVLAVLYFRGLRALRQRSIVKGWQIGLFYLGIAVNCLALLPPIDPLSDQLFFMHMIQHQMIVSLGVPLMLFGVPYFVVMSAIPTRPRVRLWRFFLTQKWIMMPLYLLSHPVIAVTFFEVMTWLWHVPYFYNLALFNDWFHLLEHGCFALSAMFMWRVIIAPHPMTSPLPLPARLLYLVLMEALNIALSATLTFTGEVIYGYEGIPEPGWWSYGPLVDQQLGGLIMWVPGGFFNYIAMTVCFFVWVHHEKEKEKREQKLNISLVQPNLHPMS